MSVEIVLVLIASYLLGSVDTAVLVARAHGVDIYEVGSGNPGTSNVLRSLGRGAAALTLLGDALKGFMAASAGFLVLDELGAVSAGLAAVIGHCYPIFHRFKGGKGVATAAGVLLWVMPVVALALAAVWGVLVAITRVASVGSLAVVVLTLPAAVWYGLGKGTLLVVGLIMAVVVWRHRGNIQRLVGRGERKVIS